MSEDDRQSLVHEVAEIVREGTRKASPVAVGTAVVLAVLFVGTTAAVFINRETIVKVFETSTEVQHLHLEHDRCVKELAAVKERVSANEKEIKDLKVKLNITAAL